MTEFSQPILRQAVATDLPLLVAMLADDKLGAQREDTSQPLNSNYRAAFDAIDRDPNNALVLAEINQLIVGMLQLTFIPYLTHVGSWRCLIEGVRVHRDCRGQGLGTILIEWSIEEARKRQCRIIQLTSDKQRPEAIKFYRSMGFEDTHEGFKLRL